MASSEEHDKNEGMGKSCGAEPNEESRLEKSRTGNDPEHCLHENPLLAKELKELFVGITAFSDESKTKDSRSGETKDSTPLNQVIDDFRLIRKIGFGGMARVFEAEQISLKRHVALKVLYSHLCLSEKATLKFKREAEASARQQHPGIVSIFAVGEYNGFHYIVEELVEEGRTLADELTSLKEMHGESSAYFNGVAQLFAPIADALDHAHASGVIHKDVKPTNILITPGGDPKVTDFGLAQIEDALILSRTGEYSGTPFYMSPEQAGSRHRKIDNRSDIFSLGITLYEALTFNRPFTGQTSLELLRKIVELEPKNPLRVNRFIPRDLSVICMKALEKRPDRRYPSMREFADDMRRFLAGQAISARPASLVQTAWKLLRQHRMASIIIISVCMMALTLSIILYQAHQHSISAQAERAMRFQPVRQALGWSASRLGNLHSTENWLLNTAPDDPDTYLLIAIRLLEQNRENIRLRQASLREAIDHLYLAAERYEKRSLFSPPLVNDCHYLLSLALFRLAHEVDPNKAESKQLLEEGMVELGKVTFFSEGKPFVGDVDPSTEAWYAKPIRLNTEHPLTHLYLGIDLFKDLYRGGKLSTFDEAGHCFEQVLNDCPENLTALLCLGRLHFFRARSFEAYALLDPAIDLLEKRALGGNEFPRYYMVYVTLGQIEMLKGNHEKAEAWFEDALGLIDKGDGHEHNIYCNLGKISYLRGETGKALELLHKALALRPGDPHVNIALGECYLHQGDLLSAMRHGIVAEKKFVAGAFLLTARIHMVQNEFKEALKKLKKIAEPEHVIPSARHRAMAGLLLTLLPPADYGNGNSLKSIAQHLAESACYLAAPEPPPVCLSAMGAADILNASYATAIKNLQKAKKIRLEWGPEIHAAHWPEEARDLFLLAMAHALRAKSSSALPEDRAKAEAYHEKGAALLNKRFHETMDMAEFIQQVHDRSKQILSYQK